MDGAGPGVRGRAHPPGRSARSGTAVGRLVRHALTVRLLSAARTGPNHLLRFGAEARPLDDRGRRDATSVAVRVDEATRVLRGPERSVVETARAAGLDATTVDAARSLDVGAWVGRAPEDIATDDLRAFFTDVTATPHAGESVAAFVGRIGIWLRALPVDADHLVVAAKPVVQAALAHTRPLGASTFWSIDVRPATLYPFDRGLGGDGDAVHA